MVITFLQIQMQHNSISKWFTDRVSWSNSVFPSELTVLHPSIHFLSPALRVAGGTVAYPRYFRVKAGGGLGQNQTHNLPAVRRQCSQQEVFFSCLIDCNTYVLFSWFKKAFFMFWPEHCLFFLKKNKKPGVPINYGKINQNTKFVFENIYDNFME